MLDGIKNPPRQQETILKHLINVEMEMISELSSAFLLVFVQGVDSAVPTQSAIPYVGEVLQHALSERLLGYEAFGRAQRGHGRHRRPVEEVFLAHRSMSSLCG